MGGNPAFEESSNQMQKKLLDAFKKAQKAGKSKKRSEGTTDGRKCKRTLKETKKMELNITSEPKAIQTKILNSTVDYDNNANDKMTKIATATSEIETTGNSQLTRDEDMSEFLSDLDMHDYSDSRKKPMTNHNAQKEWLSEMMTMMSGMDYSSSVNPEYSSIENQS